jgi:hypothetical protein
VLALHEYSPELSKQCGSPLNNAIDATGSIGSCICPWSHWSSGDQGLSLQSFPSVCVTICLNQEKTLTLVSIHLEQAGMMAEFDGWGMRHELTVCVVSVRFSFLG